MTENRGAYINIGPDYKLKFNQFDAVPHPNIRPMVSLHLSPPRSDHQLTQSIGIRSEFTRIISDVEESIELKNTGFASNTNVGCIVWESNGRPWRYDLGWSLLVIRLIHGLARAAKGWRLTRRPFMEFIPADVSYMVAYELQRTGTVEDNVTLARDVSAFVK